MKRNKLFIAGIVTVFVALLSLTLVSSTLAKYTSTVTGSDSARVAKWSWAYTPGANPNEIEFDLFNTIQDTDPEDAETDVFNKLGDGKTVIAPGTSGEFSLEFTNNSEVNATYAVDYTVQKNGIPVQFSIDGGTTWTDDLADVPATAAAYGEAKEITIQWRWAFDSTADQYPAGWNDGSDTSLGTATTLPEITVSVAVTWTQVD